MLDFFTDLDTQLMLFLNGWHTPYWDNFMWLYSSKWVWLPFYAAFVFVILRNFKWRVSALIFVAVFLTIFFADQITATLLRPIFHRLRPCNLDNPLSQFIHVVANDRGGAYGFPSAHAANAFGFAFFFHYLFRRSWLSLLLFAWALMMCYTRIYLGRHYPGDLLTGAMVGFVSASLSYYMFRYVAGSQKEKPLHGISVPLYVLLLTLLTFFILSFFYPY